MDQPGLINPHSSDSLYSNWKMAPNLKTPGLSPLARLAGMDILRERHIIQIQTKRENFPYLSLLYILFLEMWFFIS